MGSLKAERRRGALFRGEAESRKLEEVRSDEGSVELRRV